VLEAGLRDRLSRHGGETVRSPPETGRIMLAAARVGHHVFAASRACRFLSRASAVCIVEGFADRTVPRGTIS